MDEKKTYGQKLIEHDNLKLDLEDDIIEYRKKLESDVLKEMFDVIDKARATDLYRFRDFYIVMLTKMEKIGSVPHNFIFARRSCPTPVYRQSVWKYNHDTDAIEFMWSIPDMILYYHILRNQQKYLSDKECADLAKFVILMESGELLNWVKRENGEKVDAVIKIDNKENACQTN